MKIFLKNSSVSGCVIMVALTAAFSGLIIPATLYAAPQQQRFFPLNKAQVKKPDSAAPKFIPLSRSGRGRALNFVPSGRQAIKLKNHEPPPLPVAQPNKLGSATIKSDHARQLLSIYESVD